MALISKTTFELLSSFLTRYEQMLKFCWMSVMDIWHMTYSHVQILPDGICFYSYSEIKSLN